MDYKATTFKNKLIRDDRGVLIPFESQKDIPFEVKRVYFIKDLTTGSKRGMHAHYKILQTVFCISGSFRMLFDDGKSKSYEKISMGESYLIDKMVWHEMDEFSNDCIIVVFASEHYDKSDYITDYEEFRKLTR
jgi:dTDP-4-dehydrorhamnose 3,5-epimerase-like enzyme